jgi:hypothetical protein
VITCVYTYSLSPQTNRSNLQKQFYALLESLLAAFIVSNFHNASNEQHFEHISRIDTLKTRDRETFEKMKKSVATE